MCLISIKLVLKRAMWLYAPTCSLDLFLELTAVSIVHWILSSLTGSCGRFGWISLLRMSTGTGSSLTASWSIWVRAFTSERIRRCAVSHRDPFAVFPSSKKLLCSTFFSRLAGIPFQLEFKLLALLTENESTCFFFKRGEVRGSGRKWKMTVDVNRDFCVDYDSCRHEWNYLLLELKLEADSMKWLNDQLLRKMKNGRVRIGNSLLRKSGTWFYRNERNGQLVNSALRLGSFNWE